MEPLSVNARDYARDSRAANTTRAYTSDMKAFALWCHVGGHAPLPAASSLLANYAADLAKQGRKMATIERAVAAISQTHLRAGYPSPRVDETFRQVMKGIRRSIGVRPKKKRPVLVADLRALIAATGAGIKAARDRALLALGFAGAFRRSELVGLDIGDLNFTVDGLIVTLRRSKTDQDGTGIEIGIPHGQHAESCPVRLVKAWLNTLHSLDGPLFRAVSRHEKISTRRLSGKAVASLIQSLAPVAGLQAAAVGAHSLRSGFASSAVRAGRPEHLIMRHTRHKSVTVFRGYVAATSVFAENPAVGIGL
jgi:site-specific recombinase XerD